MSTRIIDIRDPNSKDTLAAEAWLDNTILLASGAAKSKEVATLRMMPNLVMFNALTRYDEENNLYHYRLPLTIFPVSSADTPLPNGLEVKLMDWNHDVTNINNDMLHGVVDVLTLPRGTIDVNTTNGQQPLVGIARATLHFGLNDGEYAKFVTYYWITVMDGTFYAAHSTFHLLNSNAVAHHASIQELQSLTFLSGVAITKQRDIRVGTIPNDPSAVNDILEVFKRLTLITPEIYKDPAKHGGYASDGSGQKEWVKQ